MRCLRIVLAWTFGVPLGLALLLSALFAWLFACVWAAQSIGLPDYVGMAVGMLFVFLGMGAWFGIQECREGW